MAAVLADTLIDLSHHVSVLGVPGTFHVVTYLMAVKADRLVKRKSEKSYKRFNDDDSVPLWTHQP